MGFVGRPLMFCRMIRSRVGGRGRIGVGPHVVFVLMRFSFVSWVGGGVSSVSVGVVLLLVVACVGVAAVLLLLLVCSVVTLCGGM